MHWLKCRSYCRDHANYVGANGTQLYPTSVAGPGHSLCIIRSCLHSIFGSCITFCECTTVGHDVVLPKGGSTESGQEIHTFCSRFHEEGSGDNSIRHMDRAANVGSRVRLKRVSQCARHYDSNNGPKILNPKLLIPIVITVIVILNPKPCFRMYACRVLVGFGVSQVFKIWRTEM